MSGLEKILEEIDDLIIHSAWPCLNLVEKEKVEEIIREHMAGKDSNVTANNGWIPVGERLPEEKVNPVSQDFYEYQVTAKFGNVKDVRYYKYGNGHWWHGPGIVDKYVTAWREIPEPYQEET